MCNLVGIDDRPACPDSTTAAGGSTSDSGHRHQLFEARRNRNPLPPSARSALTVDLPQAIGPVSPTNRTIAAGLEEWE